MALKQYNKLKIMEFKSQICTNREQSKKLLELGLKKETADMVHQASGTSAYNVWNRSEIEDDFYPAWSLHRLMEIGDFVNVGFLNIEKMFDCCIQMLEGQIRGNVINQNYINK